MAAPPLRRLEFLQRHLRMGAGCGPPRAPQQLVEEAPAAAASGERGWDMSEEELYLFDTMGFLRVRNVLDKATVAQTLEHSMGGIASGAFDDLRRSPPGQNPGGDFYDNAFLRDKVIERIARQPTMMDYVCHTLNNQPRLSEQILVVQNSRHKLNNFHLRKDSDVQIREDGPRFYTDAVNRRVYMDHVSFFVYLTDVKEGDGGLCIAPGSHHTAFKYPKSMFYDGSFEPRTGMCDLYKASVCYSCCRNRAFFVGPICQRAGIESTAAIELLRSRRSGRSSAL